MMRKLLLFITLLIMLPLQEVFSDHPNKPTSGEQTSTVPSIITDFRTDFETAMDLVNNAQYTDAIVIFSKLMKDDPENFNLHFLIGYCYVQLNRRASATPYFEKAVLSAVPDYNDNNYKERDAPVFAYFYLGQSYQWVGRYQEAEENFNTFRSFLVSKTGKLLNQKNFDVLKDVDARIIQLSVAKGLIAKPVDIKFIPIPKLNSGTHSVNGVQISDQEDIIFFNRQKLSGVLTGKSDVFQIRKTQQGWGKVESVSGNINSPYNDNFSCLSGDAKFFLFSSDRKGGFNIYYALQENGKWSEPYDNLSINSPANETYAAITKDGSSMFFVSDRPGGFGGKDIYRITKRADGSWSEPENLGFTINTSQNEDTPWLSDDGRILYFSSESHSTMGGYDIFSSEFKNQMWQEPVNLGYPINSAADELYYKPDEKSNVAFYSSNRKSEGEKLEAYCIKFRDRDGFNQTIFTEDDINDTIPADVAAKPGQTQKTKPGGTTEKQKTAVGTTKVVTQTEETAMTPQQKQTADSLAAVRLKRARDLQKKLDELRATETQRIKADSIKNAKKNEALVLAAKSAEDQRKRDSLAALGENEIVEREKNLAIEQRKQDSLSNIRRTDSLEALKKQESNARAAKLAAELRKRDSLSNVSKVDSLAAVKRQENLEKAAKMAEMLKLRDSLDAIIRQESGEDNTKPLLVKGEPKISTKVANQDSIAEAKREKSLLAKEKKQQEQKERDAIERQRKIITAIEKARKDSLARVSYTRKVSKKGVTARLIEEKLISGALRECSTPNPDRIGKFTVQVGAGKMKVRYFKVLDDKRVCFGPDGMARFIVGTYNSLQEAEKVAADLRKVGFADAWIPEIDGKRCPCNDNDIVSDVLGGNAGDGPIKYTVQLGAGNMRISYFRPVRQIRLCNGQDGLLRFIFGEFSNVDEAEKVRQKLVDIGYRDAWIPEIDENRCHDVILQ